jgi:hypothetical protein
MGIAVILQQLNLTVLMNKNETIFYKIMIGRKLKVKL